MAKQQRMFLLIAVCIYLVVAPANWVPATVPPLPGGVMAVTLFLIATLSLVTTGRRLLRIAQALRG